MKTIRLLSTNISDTTIEEVSHLLNTKTHLKVAICNANTLVRSHRKNAIRDVINSFDIATPDGFPVAKSVSKLAKKNIARVDGYKVFLKTIEDGLKNNTSHFFYGSNKKIVKLMIRNLKRIYPEINIIGYSCPPNLSVEELIVDFKKTKSNSSPQITWVCLGFPKQELFIHSLNKEFDSTSNFVGIGAVFEWVAGTKVKAPEWMANLGLEWILRLIQEPKRLFKRYLIDNTLFIYYFSKQLLFKN
jgi:N-acetylglucosaminyldiphosphoundecaprenol N-acetyl-beta-D-mannosaminyltransferase